MTRWPALCAVFLGACVGGADVAAHRVPAEYHPPPPPGFSIAGSVMCECTACSPRSCCGGGASESESRCVSTDAGVSCAADMGSCTPRCTRVAWRVPRASACDSRRPAECCGGS